MTSVGVMASAVVPGVCTDVLSEPFNNNANFASGNIQAGRNGTCLQISGSSNSSCANLTSSNYATIGFAYQTNTLSPTVGQIFRFRDSGTITCIQLNYTSTGALQLFRGSGTTSLGISAAGVITAINTWHYIEVQVFVDDTAGYFTVRCNGTTVLSGSGVDTHEATVGPIANVILSGNGSGGSVKFDDLYWSVGAACVFKGDQNLGTDTVLLEPFDNFTTAPWTVSGSPSITAGRTGNAAQCAGGTDRVDYALGANQNATVTIGFAWQTATTNVAVRQVMRMYSDTNTTQHNRLIYNGTTAQSFTLTDGTGTPYTGGTTATGLVPVNTWAYLELQIFLHDTAGTVIFKVNGVTQLNLTGLDTKSAGTKTVYDTVQLGSLSSGLTNRYDDLYISVGAGAQFKGSITL